MKIVFADTWYWVALTNPNDQWHQAAREASARIDPARLITTGEVLVEFLNFYSEYGSILRQKAVDLTRKILGNPNVSVVPQTRDSFSLGLKFYESRKDKQYSLTDCISMETMREHNVQEVLTNDHHFEQEGFTVLLTEKTL